MAIAKGIGGGFPLGACLATAGSRQGHDRRHARHHLRRQSAGHGGRQRGARRRAGPTASSTRVQQHRPACSSSGSPSSRTAIRRHRGGARRGPDDRPQAARRRTPSSSARARDEKLLAVAGRRQRRAPAAAARSSPRTRSARPSQRLDAALLGRRAPRRQPNRSGAHERPRHFLDLIELSGRRRCARILDDSARHEGATPDAAQRRPNAARRQGAGDDLREAVDAHARLLRRRACASSAARRSC